MPSIPSCFFNNLTGDDRGVFELNGVPIGNAGYESGMGYMTLTDHGANVPYEFNGNYTSGTVTDGFILGEPNLLQVVINNTGSGIQGSPQDIGPSDGTDFGVQGTLVYGQVPEPATAALALSGIPALLLRRRRAA